MWYDLRSEIPREAWKDWDDWWNTPPAESEQVDEKVLQVFIDAGQATDMADARLFFDHQQRLAKETDPLKRAAANAEFAQARRARRERNTL